MKYNPEELQTQITPKAGNRVKAHVTSIQQGTLGDFIPPELLKSWDGSQPDDPAIEVTIHTVDGYQKRRVLKYPTNNMVSPKSNLAKWKKVYGGYPHIGQEIELVADEEGFYQLLF